MNAILFKELRTWLKDNHFVTSDVNISITGRLFKDDDNEIITIVSSIYNINIRVTINNIKVEIIDSKINSIKELDEMIKQLKNNINNLKNTIL